MILPPIPADWPAHLHEFRTRHNLTPKEAAGLVFVKRRAWERWEAGTRKPLDMLAIALAWWDWWLSRTEK
jgi:DNA-binding XRE family transcriptional regulator